MNLPPMTKEHQYWSDVILVAFCVWREARAEPYQCMLEVAHSIRNRVEHPKWWGRSYATVIWAPWQYSSFTDPHDVQLTRGWVDGPVWQQSIAAARAAIDDTEPAPLPGADSYYDISISAPAWAKPEMFCGQLGRIRFFNTDGDHPHNVPEKIW